MPTAIVTSKGQITIQASVRRALHVEAGARLKFVEIETGRFDGVVARTNSGSGPLQCRVAPIRRGGGAQEGRRNMA